MVAGGEQYSGGGAALMQCSSEGNGARGWGFSFRRSWGSYLYGGEDKGGRKAEEPWRREEGSTGGAQAAGARAWQSRNGPRRRDKTAGRARAAPRSEGEQGGLHWPAGTPRICGAQ
jgi:hypothetical protein